METTAYMTNATGEKTFVSSTGRNVKTDFKPIPDGTYGGTIRSGTIEIRRSTYAKEGMTPTDNLPYVTCQVELEGTAVKEGGKNRVAFVNFDLGMAANARGVIPWESQSGLLACFKSMGEEFENVEVLTQTQSDGTEAAYLNPTQVVELLTSKAGMPFAIRLGTYKGKDGEDKQVVRAFPKRK